MGKRRQSIRSERGQSMVEFTVVLPIFCMLLFAIAEFGIVFNNYLNLTDAVRQGARYGAVKSCSGTCDNSAMVTDKVKASAANLNPSNITVTFPNTTWQSGTDETVCGTYPWSLPVLSGFIGAASGTLSSCTTERME